MKWSDIPRKPSPKVLRQFAGAWLVFFLAWGAFEGLGRGRPQIGVALASMGVVIGGWGLARTGAIRWLFVGWMVLVFPMGWLISQLALLLMFYGVLTPVAILFRLTGRDALCRRTRLDADSYWTAKEQPRDMRRYLRQY
jgi:hypothetical protein